MGWAERCRSRVLWLPQQFLAEQTLSAENAEPLSPAPGVSGPIAAKLPPPGASDGSRPSQTRGRPASRTPGQALWPCLSEVALRALFPSLGGPARGRHHGPLLRGRSACAARSVNPLGCVSSFRAESQESDRCTEREGARGVAAATLWQSLSRSWHEDAVYPGGAHCAPG